MIRPYLLLLWDKCKDHNQVMKLQELLTKFANVFSRDDRDVEWTQLVEHKILIVKKSTKIQQPLHYLCPEKNRCVAQMLEQHLIQLEKSVCR